ncbi:MAG: DNA alkylation repair protein [Actinomycetota bacterium]|nr:DNA alkylation repair protein [Actinomycetota bacterium]
MQELLSAVRTGLAAAGDPERAVGQQLYMKSAMPYRGVRMPEVTRLCRALFAEHVLPDRASWESAARTIWDEAEFREERYAAIALTGHRAYVSYQDPGSLPLYDHMIVTGAWWDYVDEVAIRRVGPILRSDPAAVSPLLREWATDDDIWRRRTSIIAQIKSTIGTDLELLTGSLAPNLAHPEFFIRKAIGWALREYAKTDPDWVRRYLADHEEQLSGLSRREAAKHLEPAARCRSDPGPPRIHGAP